MMTAIDKNGNLLNLLENIPEPAPFFCPACKTEVRLKCGKIKIPHFAHLTLKNCTAWSENESAQHLALKIALYHWFSQTEKVEIERYLPELSQTPDLLVNEKIAIEVQCSSLSLERLRERTENYLAHGFTVIWLMGRDLWLKNALTELQRNLMYYSGNRGFYFWELDLLRKRLRLNSLIHEDLRGHLMYLTDEFIFGQDDLLSLLRLPFIHQKLVSFPVKTDRGLSNFVQSQLYRCAPKWLKLQEKYYQKGRNLRDVAFDKPYFAPPGLNLLTAEFDGFVNNDFCQISQDLTEYYRNFWESFTSKPLENLYPPRFYAIMKNKSEKGARKNGKRAN